MTFEQALNKAVKCLKLSKSSNQHEAALAAARAQEIIDRYQLKVEDIKQGDEPDLSDNEEIKNFGYDDPIAEACQVDTRWTLDLSHAIARHNGCSTYYHKKPSGSAVVAIVGRPSDVNAARYIFGWLNREVRRITKEHCVGHSRKFLVDFRLGVVDTIDRKLHEQRQQTFQEVRKETQNPLALVRVERSIARLKDRQASVEVWLKENMNLKEGATWKKQINLSARYLGQMAGEQVRFTKAKGSIGQEQKPLPVVAED